ncbi:MAG: bifunctional GNAT family N-acetyltransferase/acetate--CoA ligase family protein [Dehalococcoidales bacterium]
MATDNQDVKYPAQYEAEVLLRDGMRLMLRPIRRDDVEEWLSFISRLSDRTKYLRFHHVPTLGREDAVRFCTVDYQNTFAFVAEKVQRNRKEIIAIGRYYRLPNKTSAEVAFVIEDSYHGLGIGTRLVEWLANVARDNGITDFEADVLMENDEMMTVFRDYGFHITSYLEEGVYHISFPIARTRMVARKEEERARISTLASMRYVLSPRSIAVIGASRRPGTIGQLLFECVMQNRFSGVVYPINPKAESVMSVKAYPSVLDVPGNIDLAIVAVPAELVIKVVDECGHKGVRAVIVISDGFSESGSEGKTRERELRSVTLGYGMRLVGPNCMGVINTDPEVSMNASFSPIFPTHGNVAFLSQSGAMGLAILDYARSIDMGISGFASVGNRADISANDFLHYWEQDCSTRVLLLYLESFGNPRSFGRIARRVSASKPIAAVKSGRSAAGSRAASSHTGAMASSDVASEALFRQAGIIRVNTMGELFDVATLLSGQPVAKGRRVFVVTNGGGPGILAADACEQYGLKLPPLGEDTKKKLRTVLRRDIPLNNPLDTTAGATGKEFEGILETLARDKENDAVIAIFMPPIFIDPNEMENAVKKVLSLFRKKGKPLLVCAMRQQGVKEKLGSDDFFVPRYSFPEDAVLALSRSIEYGEWVKRPKGKLVSFTGLKRRRARKIVESALTSTTRRPLWMSSGDMRELLSCYGIRVAESGVAATESEAGDLASKIGFPVVVKLASDTITHKTDVGGVVLNLKSAEDVEHAFSDIKSKLVDIGREDEMKGVVVQKMVKGGIEAIVGVTQDPLFGPLIMFGVGGIHAELLNDVVVKLHPLTDRDARDLVGSVRMAKLFSGLRGTPPSDTQSLEELLLRISALVEDIPELAEMDLNPVKVMAQGKGYWVVDARATLK